MNIINSSVKASINPVINNSSQNSNTAPPVSQNNILPTNDSNSFELIKNPSQFFGIWYPSTSIIPSTLSETELKKYQIIINPSRIMINGGCNNVFSSYTISSGTLGSLRIISPAGKCSVDKDFILQAIIYSSSNVYYISSSGKNAIIQIRSPKG